jgi:hypothetical protein
MPYGSEKRKGEGSCIMLLSMFIFTSSREMILMGGWKGLEGVGRVWGEEGDGQSIRINSTLTMKGWKD